MYLVWSEVLQSSYRWVTGYVPETACCAVAGVGIGKTGPNTTTLKGRLWGDIWRPITFYNGVQKILLCQLNIIFIILKLLSGFVTCKRIIGPNFLNKNINSELYINLIIRDIQRSDKLLEVVTSFITIQVMYYNITFRRVRVFIVVVERNIFYIFWMRVCSHLHVAYSHLWPVCLYYIFPHFLIKSLIKKRVFEYSMRVLFLYIFFSEKFLILRRAKRYIIINIIRYSCNETFMFFRFEWILNILDRVSKILKRIKEIPSSVCGVPCGWLWRSYWSLFAIFETAQNYNSSHENSAAGGIKLKARVSWTSSWSQNSTLPKFKSLQLNFMSHFRKSLQIFSKKCFDEFIVICW